MFEESDWGPGRVIAVMCLASVSLATGAAAVTSAEIRQRLTSDARMSRGRLICTQRATLPKVPAKVIEARLQAYERALERSRDTPQFKQQSLERYRMLSEARKQGKDDVRTLTSFWKADGHRRTEQGTAVNGKAYELNTYQLGPDQCQFLTAVGEYGTSQVDADTNILAGHTPARLVYTLGVPVREMIDLDTAKITQRGKRTVVTAPLLPAFLKKYYGGGGPKKLDVELTYDLERCPVPLSMRVTSSGRPFEEAVASGVKKFAGGYYPAQIRIDVASPSSADYSMQVREFVTGETVADTEFVPVTKAKTFVIDQRLERPVNYTLDPGKTYPDRTAVRQMLQHAHFRPGLPRPGVLFWVRLLAVIAAIYAAFILVQRRRVHA